MELEETVEPAEGVVSADIEGGTVLLDLRTEQVYSLHDTATDVWAYISTGPKTLPHILHYLNTLFDVSPDMLRHDLNALIGEWHREGLIRMGP